jgi:apolipoprotein N-acyltransferase
VTGVHGITFVVVAVNAALAQIALAPDRAARSRAIVSAALAGAVVLGSFGYGVLRLRSTFPSAGPVVTVGVVQANLPLGSQWRRSFYGRNLDVYEQLSVDLLKKSRPKLLVWPESAMTFFLDDEPTYRHAIGSLLSSFGMELVAGGPYAAPGGQPPFRNAAFHVGPDGEIRARYDKQILLPFAEYFPLGRFDILQRNFGRVREFVPGDREAKLLDTAAGRVGVVICNEGFFGAPVADRVRAGATLLVNLANDSWLGEAKYSEPAFDMVRLRAVEQRRWIVRASTAGPSAIVDPFGRVVERTALFQSTALAGTVMPITAITWYSRLGDAFAWTCIAAALLAWTWRSRGQA